MTANNGGVNTLLGAQQQTLIKLLVHRESEKAHSRKVVVTISALMPRYTPGEMRGDGGLAPASALLATFVSRICYEPLRLDMLRISEKKAALIGGGASIHCIAEKGSSRQSSCPNLVF